MSRFEPWFVIVLIALLGCGQDDRRAEVIAMQEDNRLVETIDPLLELAAEYPDDPEISYRLGMALLADQQFGMAVWPLRRAADSPEYAIEAGLQLAWAAHKNGTHDDAVAAATRVLEVEPENLGALLVRGRSHLAAYREKDALDDFDRMESIDPDDLSPAIDRVLALAKLGEVEEARERLAETRERVGEGEGMELADQVVCTLVAVFSQESGDKEEAEQQHELCLEQFPNSGLVQQHALEFFDAEGRMDRSSEILRAALEADPKRGDLRENLAFRILGAGDSEGAEALLREGLDHDQVMTWVSLAFFHEAQSDPLSAKEALSKAVPLMRQVPHDLRLAYADIASRAGDHDLALAQIPDLPWPGFESMIRGRVDFERGDFAESLRHFDEAIVHHPSNPGLRTLAGQAAEQVGDIDRALAEYRGALRVQTPGHDAGLKLATLLEAMGNRRAALTTIQRHLNENPNDVEGAKLSARLALEVGDRALARQGLRQVALLAGPGAAFAIRTGFAADAEEVAPLLEAMRSSGLDFGAQQNHDAIHAYVDLLLRTGKADDAQRIVREALDAHPDDADLIALHARIIEEGDRASASALYERALTLVPDHPAALHGLSRLAEAEGDASRALAYVDRALKARPEDGEIAWRGIRLAEAQAEGGGATADLIRRYEARIRQDPRDREAALALAKAELASSPERSLQLAKRASRLGAGKAAAEAIEAATALIAGRESS